MKSYFEGSPDKTEPEPRNLLSVAYKNVVGSRRNAWRVLSGIKAKEEGAGKSTEVVDDYIKTVEKELDDICMEVIVS